MGRSIRWQALIAFLGVILLAAILASTTRQLTTVSAPEKGGIYREAAIGSPRLINPLFSFSGELDRDLTGLIFQGLTALNEHGEPLPVLAESWQISADQKEITFSLRRSVRWHDGAPFTATDVLYTVEVLQSDAFAASGQPASTFLSELWRNVTVERVDDYTVRFRLKQALAPFLAETTIGILPAHLWSKVPADQLTSSLLNLQPVGTGPWRLANLNATMAQLEPNPYAAADPPFLDAIELYFYPDYTSAFAAFNAGDVDGVSRIVPQNMAAAQTSPAMEVFSAPLAGATFVYFNLRSSDKPFLADPVVRQALNLALDKNKLIDTVLQGQGIAADGPLMRGNWAYTPGAGQATDLQRAAQMLTELGWSDSNRDGVRDREGAALAFTLLGDDEALLQELAEQWRQIGVQATPQLVTLTSLAGDYLSPRRFEAAVTHWQLSGDPDPYPLWHSTQIDNGQNYTGWSNPDADLTMEEGRSTNDPGRRIQLYSEFQRLFRQELPALPLFYNVYSFGVSDAVKDVAISQINWPWERFRSAARWYVSQPQTNDSTP